MDAVHVIGLVLGGACLGLGVAARNRINITVGLIASLWFTVRAAGWL